MKNTLLIICFLLTQVSVVSEAVANNLDSLRQELKNLPDSSKLIRLNELLYQNNRNFVFKTYADMLLEEAQRQKNDLYKGNALLSIMRYYYSKNPDSLRF